MKQGAFEQRYRPLWSQLNQQIQQLEAVHVRRQLRLPLGDFVLEYRQLCHHLALSRERSYSWQLQEELNALVLRAHRQLYRHNPPIFSRIGQFLASDFPHRVRQQWRWHSISALCFVFSLALTWLLVRSQPELVYTLLAESMVSDIESMYVPGQSQHLASRDSGDDLTMFGYYIRNNIGIAFRTFAAGLLFGVGALAIMVFNGGFFGAVAAHLLHQNAGEPFFTFVIAHGAPELIAIVLAGGAGLQLGWSLIAPGNQGHRAALREAAGQALPTLYGVFVLLLLAAFIEAFWSPREFPAAIKYGVGALCWALIVLYLGLSGRQGGNR